MYKKSRGDVMEDGGSICLYVYMKIDAHNLKIEKEEVNCYADWG